MINITTLQNDLYAWVIAQTSRTTIWRHPNAPRPSLPYIDLMLDNINSVGQDYNARPTSSISGSKTCGNREFTLSINHYGADSMQMLETLKTSLEFATVNAYLDSKGIAFVDRLTIQNLTDLIDSRYEERAMMDLLFRIGSEVVDSAVPIISTLKLQKTFKNEVSTILVENVEITEIIGD